MDLSTYIGVLFDRHIELLLQLSHRADSFRKLLHVPPIEHATVHCVVVHVLAHPANFCGRDKKQNKEGIKLSKSNYRQPGKRTTSVTFLHTSAS